MNGKSYSPSALNAFTTLATKFLQANPAGTIPVVPPTAAFAGDSLVISATGGTGQVTFTANLGNQAGTVTELLLQPLKSRNRTPNPKGYRSKAFKPFAGGSLTQVVSVPTGFYAAAYRYVNSATGQATPLIALPVLTVALSLEDGGQADAPVTRKKAA